METSQKLFYETPTSETVEVKVRNAILIASAEGMHWENDDEQ